MTLGLAQFFGDCFSMVQRDCVETIQNPDVKDEGCQGKGEEDWDHEPGSVQVQAKKDDGKADSKTGQNNAQCDQCAKLRGLFPADLRQVDFFGCAKGAEIADGSVGEGGEEEPAEGCEGDERRRSAGAEGENS